MARFERHILMVLFAIAFGVIAAVVVADYVGLWWR